MTSTLVHVIGLDWLHVYLLAVDIRTAIRFLLTIGTQ